ncbi:MAG: hypothetical protein F4138_04460 [Acidimicrobiia bacterium]|nr:hypothetical protein [Acidimicrobiia bacterium]MYC58472.1 hypothetical protein [Acidimicrobiia bacterium]MYG94230.1 hypothetical protein [Acidimicrobiia bacterium]MYI30422.1 hypothetical protein [Acidimicrobiia bacterium]
MKNPDEPNDIAEDGFSESDFKDVEEGFDNNLDVDLDAEDFDDENLANGLDEDDLANDLDAEDDSYVDEDDDTDATVISARTSTARTSNMAEEEDGEAEDIDPDNVEADLDTILKDRLAASDDEADEEEEVAEPTSNAVSQVKPKKENEWTCQGCFLIVNSAQFGPRNSPRCPSGEDPCPSLERL